MRINHPVFDPLRAVMLSSRSRCPAAHTVRPCPAVLPLYSPTRPQTAPSVPTMPSPALDHTTRPAPLCAPLCASTRAPDAQTATHAVTLSSVPHAQTHAQAPTSPCERVHALPPCPIPPQPQNAPRAPQKAPCEPCHTHTRARPRARTLCDCAHCSNLHNVDRPTLCKTLKVQKVRKNTCKTPLTSCTIAPYPASKTRWDRCTSPSTTAEPDTQCKTPSVGKLRRGRLP